MLLEIENVFSIEEWKLICSSFSELKGLSEQVRKLDNSSKTLGSLLDNLITVILTIETELTKTHTDKAINFLNELKSQSYKLVGILTDNPAITHEQLALIQLRRKIDPHFLPKHLPDDYFENNQNDRLFENYKAVFDGIKKAMESEDPVTNQVGFGLDKKSIEGKIERLEKKLDEKRKLNEVKGITLLKKRIKDFNKLLLLADKLSLLNTASQIKDARKKTLEKFSKWAKARLRTDYKALNEKSKPHQKLLSIADGNYYKIEVLPKRAEQLADETTPQYEDLLQYYKQFQKQIHVSEDINLLPATSAKLQGKLNNELERLINKFNDSIFNGQNPYTPNAIIEEIRNSLLVIVETFEINSYCVSQLAGLKKAIRLVGGKYDLNVVHAHKKYLEDHPEECNKAINKQMNVLYMDEQVREQYRLHIHKGKFYRSKLLMHKVEFERFHSNLNYSHEKKGWVSLVMSIHGEIFAASHEDKEILHSSFLSAENVPFGGEMAVASDGRIVAVSNYSGHYQPDLKALERFAQHLHQRGFDLSKTIFFEVDEQLLSRRLSQAKKWGGGSEEKKRELKREVQQDSMRLKLSNRYYFRDGKLIKTYDYNKILKTVASGLVAILLLTLLAGVIFASQGTVLPIITPILLYLASLTTPTVSVVAAITSTSVASLIPLIIAGNLVEITQRIKFGFRSLFDKVEMFWQKKESSPPNSVPSPVKKSSGSSQSTNSNEQKFSGKGYQQIILATDGGPHHTKEDSNAIPLPNKFEVLTVDKVISEKPSSLRGVGKASKTLEEHLYESPAITI